MNLWLRFVYNFYQHVFLVIRVSSCNLHNLGMETPPFLHSHILVLSRIYENDNFRLPCVMQEGTVPPIVPCLTSSGKGKSTLLSHQ